MLKSFATKAIVPPALAVTCFVVVNCILLYSVNKTDMINDTIRHETNLADTIVKSTRYAMMKVDRESLRNIIDNVGGQKGVEHVRIFNKKGTIMLSAHHEDVGKLVDKKAAGCVACHAGPVATTQMGRMEHARRFINERGKNVIAITAPIYNEPECYNATCHVHGPEQKVLGTLDIGLSEEPLHETLSVMRTRMVIFCLMVLVLTVGGVSALLRRNVLLPIKDLLEYVNAINRGELSRKAPSTGNEVGELARSYQELAASLEQSRDELERLKHVKGSPGQNTRGSERAGSP